MNTPKNGNMKQNQSNEQKTAHESHEEDEAKHSKTYKATAESQKRMT